MREGGRLYCRCHRHAKSALIKGLRLQRQRAQGPALLSSPPPPNYKTHQKEGRETTLPLVVLAGNPTPERERKRERENKKILRKEAEEACKDMKRETKSELQR